MTVGFISFAVLFLLAFSGLPIALAMGLVGLVVSLVYYGGIQGVSLTGLSLWSFCHSWVMSMIPLFVFMGALANVGGVGKDVYDMFNVLLSKVRGSLAIVAQCASAAFGAITGSTTATIATIGSISLPEMKRLGYSAKLRTGSVATAGALGNLIPPSILAIVYCTAAQASIGKVFMANLIPGVILMVLNSIVVYTWGRIDPSIAPVQSRTYSFKEKMAALPKAVPVAVIFVLMIGGIYRGIFSPTEAASVGATMMLITLLTMRRLTKLRFVDALQQTIRITAFIILLLAGAKVFMFSLSLSGFSMQFTDFVCGLPLPPLGTMFAIVAAIIFLGCVMDACAVLFLVVPLFMGTAMRLGYDPVWFGTLNVLLAQVGCITPPIAPDVWCTKMVDPDASLKDISLGVIPFYAAELSLVALLIFFPQVALWLPSTMF